MAEEKHMVGDYELLGELGRGGMAVVFKARQASLDRHVALKQLGSFHAADPTVASRFLSESRITGSLSHPNIVTVHEYFQHDATPYIAMEFVEGGSLRPHVGRLTLPQIGGVLEGILAALDFAGDRGIVHRDLKPENVMVTGTGSVKVADFGIAKAINAVTMGHQTATGTTVGTPSYMAPEQAMGKEVTPKTDLYAAGVIAYELLSGSVPFSSQDTPMAVLLMHVNETPAPLSETDPSIDADLVEWVGRMLAKDPGDRPADAETAWDDFEGILIRLAGPRWRREARLGATVADATTPKPLTPAPFDASAAPPEGQEGFETFAPGGAAPTEVDAPSPAGPAPTVVPATAASGDAPVPTDAGSPPAEETDGFKTYNAPPPVQPPPPQATPPPEPPPPPPVTKPEPPAAVVAPTAMETAAPEVPEAPLEPDPEPPARSAGSILKERWWVAAIGVAAALGVIGAFTLFGGGGGDEEPSADPAPAEGSPDVVADQLPDLVVDGESLVVVETSGQITRIAPNGTAEGQTTDIAGPRALAALPTGGVLVAGADGVTLLQSDLSQSPTREPKNARYLAGTMAAAGSDGTGTVCTFAGSGTFDTCADLDFVPSGLGAGAGTALVANAEAGTVSSFSVTPAAVTPRGTVDVGISPHGKIVTDQGNAYVAVDRGIAVVGIQTDTLQRTIPLPGTAAALALGPGGKKLFAALPNNDRVAVIDLEQPEGEPELINTGSGPSAVTSGSAQVVVFNSGERNLVLLDGATGVPTGMALPIPEPAATPMSVVTGVTSSASDRRTTFVIRVGGSGLTAADVRLTDQNISDGRAALVLSQPGIRSGAGNKTENGASIAFNARQDEVLVAISAAPGAFESMKIANRNQGKSIRIDLTAPAPEPEPVTPVQPSTPSTPSTPSGGGGGGGGGGPSFEAG